MDYQQNQKQVNQFLFVQRVSKTTNGSTNCFFVCVIFLFSVKILAYFEGLEGQNFKY